MKIRVLLAFVVVLLGAGAQAAEPANYIKYRQAIMKALGGHMAATSAILRGKVEGAPGELALHAETIAGLMADLTRLFPEGSDFGETEAKESVWEDPEGFTDAAKKGASASRTFADAANGGNAASIQEGQKALGKACKGCHKNYREKDKD